MCTCHKLVELEQVLGEVRGLYLISKSALSCPEAAIKIFSTTKPVVVHSYLRAENIKKAQIIRILKGVTNVGDCKETSMGQVASWVQI